MPRQQVHEEEFQYLCQLVKMNLRIHTNKTKNVCAEASFNRCLVVGVPGSGKTTLVDRVAEVLEANITIPSWKTGWDSEFLRRTSASKQREILLLDHLDLLFPNIEDDLQAERYHALVKVIKCVDNNMFRGGKEYFKNQILANAACYS